MDFVEEEKKSHIACYLRHVSALLDPKDISIAYSSTSHNVTVLTKSHTVHPNYSIF